MDEGRLYRLVGSKIRSAREQKRPRMSQEKLAKHVDLKRVSIVNIEAGRQRAPLHTLWEIADKLDLTIFDIIPNQDELDQFEAPFILDAETAALIEAEANGDPRTHELLSRFVTEVRSKNRKQL